ncbi:unnamed protein product [Durusdinium trenchii]|uniref:Uncharacterized protein n=1 Tax=Durusdinium trenchii TaxID=1381693 RepID=A0ABP0KHD3_9DINO
MAWHSWLPHLSVPKKVAFDNPKLNVLYYIFHLPIIAYAVAIFAFQKQYSEVISNSPFLMVNVDPLDAWPYLLTTGTPDPDPSIQAWCLASGGPALCESDPVLYATCVEMVTEHILSQMPGMSITSICTGMCDLNNISFGCMIPPSLFRQQGSTALQIIPYVAFNKGLFSGANRNMLVQMNPLLRYAPVTFNYSFQMSRPAPWFFSNDQSISDKKTNLDAYTVAITVRGNALLVFNPGEPVIVTPPNIVTLAGVSWNVTTIIYGGEFYAVVNCYTDSYDMPSVLDWSGFPEIDPTLEIPVCLLTVEQLRPISMYKQTDTVADSAQAASQIRVDTGRGSSYHRCPSAAAIALNLISLAVLLKFPAMAAVLFATKCLGSLSKIYKRAQEETFDVSMRIAQLGLRLLSDTMALMLLDQKASGISKARLREQMCDILKTAAPSQDHNAIADELSQHIFRMLRHLQHSPSSKYEEGLVDSSQLATLMSLGQTVHINDLCAYFDTSRRRSYLEWFLLPSSHRKLLREKRALSREQKDDRQDVKEEMDPEDSKAEELPEPGMDEGKEEDARTGQVGQVGQVEVRVSSQREILEVEALEAEIDGLMAEVKALKVRQNHREDQEAQKKQVEDQVTHLFVAVEDLVRSVDSLEEVPNATAKEGLEELRKGTDALDARISKFEQENAQLSREIKALHAWADARQEAQLQELEVATAIAQAASRHTRPEEEEVGIEAIPKSAPSQPSGMGTAREHAALSDGGQVEKQRVEAVTAAPGPAQVQSPGQGGQGGGAPGRLRSDPFNQRRT